MWKIQYNGVNGWYDLRESSDVDDKYRVVDFETEIQAHTEASLLTDIFEKEFRVVPVSTAEDWTPYC
jgi:hypothetical protein